MDTYQAITNRVIAMLENGVVPWQKPWRYVGPDGGPRNLLSQKPYRGINVFLLNAMGYESPYWLTFSQAKRLGGHVNKGEKSSIVVFWNWLEKTTGKTGDDTGDKTEKIPFLRYHRVFNLHQCSLPEDKIPPMPERPEFDSIAECESVVTGMPNAPVIHNNGGNRAFYRQGTDTVHMPQQHAFRSSQAYYATLFHELAHATGHSSRLNRKTLTEYDGFGGQNYSREELVAEMGSAFLCGMTGIETATIDNSASYLASWLKALKSDKRMVVTAAAQAQKAADYILNKNTPSGS